MNNKKIDNEKKDYSNRYMVSIEVYDNETGEMIINEGFNTPHKWYAADALQKAADKLN